MRMLLTPNKQIFISVLNAMYTRLVFIIYGNVAMLTGITRLQRWNRAKDLGLNPPREVLTILTKHPGNYEVQEWWVK